MAYVISCQGESFNCCKNNNKNQQCEHDNDRRSPSLQEEQDCVVMLDPSEHFRPENGKAVEEFRRYSDDQVSLQSTRTHTSISRFERAIEQTRGNVVTNKHC